MIALKAVCAFGHARRDPAHLAGEIKVRVRTFDAAHTGASAEASSGLRNLAAVGELPPKHGALILGSLRLGGDGILDLILHQR